MNSKIKWILGVAVILLVGGGLYLSNSSLQKGALRVPRTYSTGSSTPDLVVTNLHVSQELSGTSAAPPSTDPVNLLINTGASVYADIFNSGVEASGDTVTRLEVDRIEVSRTPTGALVPNSGNENEVFTWTPSIIGRHTVRVCADANNETAESNEVNNCIGTTVNVVASLLPDLVIQPLTFTPSNPVTVGTRVIISSPVGNVGMANSEADEMYVTLNVGRTPVASQSMTGRVAPNQTIATAWVQTFSQAGVYNIDVCVDYNGDAAAAPGSNSVTESEESNNCTGAALRVVEPVLAQCTRDQYSCGVWSSCARGKQTGSSCTANSGTACRLSSSPTRSC